jgi:phage tail-like protein
VTLVDVNGTRFQLIQGNADWMRCQEDGDAGAWSDLFWDDAAGCVTLAPLLPIVPPPGLGGPLDRSRRRGAAADRYGHWYWIGNDAQSIAWLPRGAPQVLPLWPQAALAAPQPLGGFAAASPEVPAVMTFAGLAVTRHNYLVAGTVTPPGLLIFDLDSGGRPSLLRMPDGVAFAPFDIAAAADGGCWVLDNAHRAYWGFDGDFRALAQVAAAAPPPPAFQPVDGSAIPAPAAPPVPGGFAVAAADPIAIEGLPDGSVLVLDGAAESAPGGNAAASLLYRYRRDQQFGAPLALQGAVEVEDKSTGALQAATLDVAAHDIAYNPQTHTLYAVDRFGRQSVAFALSLAPTPSLMLQRTYLPMHSFGGRALVAWNDGGTTSVSYDVVGGAPGNDKMVRWARLQTIDRPRFARDAVLVTPVLDGKARDCTWDSLFLDACIPPGTTVKVSTCADNDADLVNEAMFVDEPTLHLRPDAAEIPFYDAFADRDPKPATAGTWEVLLQQARGRYLKVRLELTGNGRASPQLRALRVYYPRFSYARQYLPAVYVEDPVSASFVERLLANPKGFYTEIEGKIRNVGMLFDPRSARPEDLDWLAGWLGLTFDPLWEKISARLQTGSTDMAPVEDRRRLFIRFATRLFSRRGTPDGIRFALHLLLEPCLETTLRRFRSAALTPDAALNQELVRLGLQPPSPTDSENDIEDLLTSYLLSPQRPSKVRLVERFMTRGNRALAQGDPTLGANAASSDSVAATAHRFAVLVPETLPADIAAMVSRIVELEKPAHTAFEVRRYWDYFRVGEARLGIDTVLGEDSRFLPIVLGESAVAGDGLAFPPPLGGGFLAYPPPTNAADRVVLGRDRVGTMPAL